MIDNPVDSSGSLEDKQINANNECNENTRNNMKQPQTLHLHSVDDNCDNSTAPSVVSNNTQVLPQECDSNVSIVIFYCV